MKLRKILAVLSILALLAGVLFHTGCNTWEGAGKDLEEVGDSMQSD